MYLQPSTALQNSIPKWAGQNPERISLEEIYHGMLARTSSNTTPLRSCIENQAKMLLKGHFGIKCHSQYIRCIIVNGVYWGCIVRDLETIIVLVLLTFNFIPQRSHHSLILPRSLYRDSATVTITLTPGVVGTTSNKVN